MQQFITDPFALCKPHNIDTLPTRNTFDGWDRFIYDMEMCDCEPKIRNLKEPITHNEIIEQFMGLYNESIVPDTGEYKEVWYSKF
jgi:hypothetical protein